MNYNIRKIILILLLLVYGNILIGAVPIPPILTNVTVKDDGSALLTWNPSSSTGIAGYVVYLLINGEGFAIDTIRNPGAVSYQNLSSSAVWYSESYVVATLDNAGNVSPLSNSLSTIHLLANADTCSSNIKLTWTRYIPYGSPLDKTRVMVSENGSPYIKMYESDPAQLSCELSTLNGGNLYCIKIEAIRNDSVISSSNISCKNSGSKRPPAWISIIGYQPSGMNSSEIVARFDPSTDLTLFRLESAEKGASLFRNVQEEQSVDGMLTFSDPASSFDKQTLYKVSAVNGCGNLVSTSNIISTIVIQSESADGRVLVKWTPASGFSGQTYGFQLSRNTGVGYSVIADLTGTDTLYVDSFSDFYRDITTDKVEYRVRAIETNNPFTDNGFVLSAGTSEPLLEQVFAANAFTPDGDNINDNFVPLLSFTPVEFQLEIRNKGGRFIFTSNDWQTGWNGRNSSGEIMPPDVYLWFMKCKSPSGRVISRKGTISILP